MDLNTYQGYKPFLQSRANLYTLLGHVFYQHPVADAFEKITTDLQALVTNVPAEEEIPGIEDLRLFTASGKTFTENLAEVQRDYQDLFEGPGRLLAPPWESVYLSEEHLVFEEQTLQVRQFYWRYGLQSNHLGKEPDDHIGLELQFLAHLGGKTLAALVDQPETLEQLTMDQIKFLEDHLLAWVPQFASRVQRHAQTAYFKGWAAFLPQFIEDDWRTLQELL